LPLPVGKALGAGFGFVRVTWLRLGSTWQPPLPMPGGPPQSVGLGREYTVDLEVTMKGASKPKKLGKKVAQKSLKEKRQDKRAAAKKGFGAS
jgi:hypothetical protein